MKLLKLIEGINNLRVINPENPEIMGFTDVSTEVKEGFLFGAFKGLKTDGIKYIEDALKREASAILTHKEIEVERVPILISDSEREVFGRLVKKFYKNIDEKMNIIGITGTNGKTSVSYILEAALLKLSVNVGVIGTVNYRWKNRKLKAKLTTPQVHTIFEFMQKIYKERVKNLIIEVSSHAIDTKRVCSICFDYAVFTNLSGDHLDYHKTMENYFSVKSKFIKRVAREGKRVFINGDDPYGRKLLEKLDLSAISFGFSELNEIKVIEYKLGKSGTFFAVDFSGERLQIKTNLIGKTNIYNILPVIGILKEMGFSNSEVEDSIRLSKIKIPGRLDLVENPFTNVYIDYSHSDDSLKKAILTLKGLGFKKVISVFGAGGDRDRSKRPRMGKVATELSDLSIITSDNPRSEDPEKIIEDILKGVVGSKYIVIVDREEAIKKAIEIAGKNDAVLIAGKGHEDYQILRDGVIHFSDFEVAKKALEEVKGKW